MPLLQALLNLLSALLEVFVATGGLILPWLPLIAWTVFWALAVNWEKLAAVIRTGAFLGIAMIALLAVLVWGCVSPPIDGHHYFEMLGVRLSVSNFTGKLVYVFCTCSPKSGCRAHGCWVCRTPIADWYTPGYTEIRW